MIYGDDKIRDMARSLLPAKNRKQARKQKRQKHRQIRAANKRILDNAVIDNAVFFDAEDGRDRNGIRSIKYFRRQYDKTKPFARWATAITKDLPQESRYSFVKGLLPEGTIGDHALTHLPLDHFENPNTAAAFAAYSRCECRHYHFPPHYTVTEIAALVRKALIVGLHKRMNRAIQHISQRVQDGWTVIGDERFPTYRVVGPKYARKCLGLHDVESFAKDVLGARTCTKIPGSHHPEWHDSLIKFLETVKEEL